MDNSLPAQERAIAHGPARSEGGPIDPALRVTWNFHPDRRVGEVPILQTRARDGLYRSPVRDRDEQRRAYRTPGRRSVLARLRCMELYFLPTTLKPSFLIHAFWETDVQQWAVQLPCALEWHHGFRLSVGELQKHPEYRGAEYIELGIAIAQGGYLDPKMLGDASGTGVYEDQALKRVWHYIGRFGSFADANSGMA